MNSFTDLYVLLYVSFQIIQVLRSGINISVYCIINNKKYLSIHETLTVFSLTGIIFHLSSQSNYKLKKIFLRLLIPARRSPFPTPDLFKT